MGLKWGSSRISKMLKSTFVLKKILTFQYEFQWQVSERDAKTDGAFFTQTEKKDVATPDRTEGEYRVWLPDGR